MTKQFLLSLMAILWLSSVVHAQFIFPEQEGWERDTNTTIYTHETLWEYINGAADYYLKYGFEKMKMMEYHNSTSDYIVVEVYQHKDDLNAFGIYSFERPSKTNYIKMGLEGYLEPSALHFWVDNYYIKISANKENYFIQMKQIANAILVENKLMCIMPDFLKAFPQENKVPYSEKFYAQNYLGHQFLHSALEVTYQEGNSKLKLFTIDCVDKIEAHKMIQSYLDFVKSEEKIIDKKILELNDIFTGLVYITCQNNQVFGCVEAESPAMATKYLNQLIAKENP